MGRVGRHAIWFDDHSLNDPHDCSYQNCMVRDAASLGYLPPRVQGPVPVAGDDRRRYLDLQGNKNGTFDIGDLARWLARTGNGAAPGTTARASGRRP